MSEEQMEREFSNSATPSSGSKRSGGRGLLVVILLAIAVGAVWLFLNADSSKAVATVNGETITKGEYQTQFGVIENQWSNLYEGQEGVPAISSAEVQDNIKVATMDSLINDRLIREAASGAGIVVSDAEVESMYQESRSFYQTEADLRAALRENGLNEAGLRENIYQEIILTRVVESMVPAEALSVSEEELREIYDFEIASMQSGAEEGEEQEEVMSFEEFSEFARPQVESSKLQEAYFTVVETLREGADIQILMDLPELEVQDVNSDLQVPEIDDFDEGIIDQEEEGLTDSSGEESVEGDTTEESESEESSVE